MLDGFSALAWLMQTAPCGEGKAPPPPSRFLDGGDVAERVAALILHPAHIAFGDRGGVLTTDLRTNFDSRLCLAKLLLPHPVLRMGEMSPNALRH